jgi:class 3 adenylate cyclase
MVWEDSDSAQLWALIEERARSGADTEAIDRRIWERFGEDWAVVFTDLVGFSRCVAEFGIVHFLQIIHDAKRIVSPIVERHGGTFVKIEADSFLILFRDARHAVECTLEMQRACQTASVDRAPEDRLILCAGVGYGRMLKIGDEDVFGHEVNLASRLGEDTAKADEILATRAARAAAGDVTGVTWEQRHVEFANETTCWAATYDKRSNG